MWNRLLLLGGCTVSALKARLAGLPPEYISHILSRFVITAAYLIANKNWSDRAAKDLAKLIQVTRV